MVGLTRIGLGGRQETIDELLARVREAEKQRLQAEVVQLQASSSTQAMA